MVKKHNKQNDNLMGETKMEVTFTGTVTTILNEMKEFLESNGMSMTQMTLPMDSVNIEKPKKEKVKKEAPVKMAEEGAEVSAVITEPDVTVIEMPATREAAAAILKKVNSSINLATARESLMKFGVEKFAELKPADYAKFIGHCDVLLINDHKIKTAAGKAANK